MERPLKKTKIDHSSPLDTNKKNTDLIPTDIEENILQRLSAESIAKFVRVSKSWVNIIRSNYFINSFQIQQQSHRLLFAINKNLDFNWNFFSSSSSDDEKPPLKFISRMTSKFNNCSYECEPIYMKGLVNFMFGSTQRNRTQIISNPSTGKSIVLPVIKERVLDRFFGFDSINCEYKVLCIMGPRYGVNGSIITPCHKILSVGFNSCWRKTELWILHHPLSNGVCIDGIIYYLASNRLDYQLMLVRFDVRSEKFLKQIPCLFLESFKYLLNLVIYNSKLAVVRKPNEQNSIDLWVLEDVERDEWCKISHDVSPWRSSISGYVIEMLGTTRGGEIVYICHGRDGMLYVIYQDHKKKGEYRRVDITSKIYRDYSRFMWRFVFIDYVESVMLL